MYKIFFKIAVCVFIFSNTQAQTAPRYDTVMVAVFNTGAKYRIAPAEFGGNTSTLFDSERKFIGTLVAGNDTIHTWGTKNCDTCKIQKKQTTLTVSHGCNNVHGDIKDKVVIIDLGNCKDGTKMALSAQKLGAKAVIFTHWHDNRDSITLKRDGGDNSAAVKKTSVADSVKIPVFTVRNTTGAKMSAMLPSSIGMREPKILQNEQNLQNIPNDRNLSNIPNAVNSNQNLVSEKDSVKITSTVSSNQNTNSDNRITNQPSVRLNFSPNPTDDLIYLRYKFDAP